MRQEHCRLVIDFRSREAMREWFDSLRSDGLLPEGAAIVEMDALDRTSSGVTPDNTYLVRSDSYGRTLYHPKLA